MRLFCNILWLILFGWELLTGYVVASLSMFVTIIGIPFGMQILKVAVLSAWPFGAEVRTVDSDHAIPLVLNIIWMIFGGIWLALTHWLSGLLCYITIIGIPFGHQHFKMASLALCPFGKEIVYPED